MPGLRVRSMRSYSVGVIADDPLPNGFDANGYVMVIWDGRDEPIPEHVEFLTAN